MEIAEIAGLVADGVYAAVFVWLLIREQNRSDERSERLEQRNERILERFTTAAQRKPEAE